MLQALRMAMLPQLDRWLELELGPVLALALEVGQMWAISAVQQTCPRVRRRSWNGWQHSCPAFLR